MPNDFLEKTLEDIIFYNLRRVKERGLEEDFYDHSQRQFVLPSGKKIDILTWQIRGGVLYAKIIELKKDATTNAALWQGLEYMDEFLGLTIEQFVDVRLDLILIGDEVFKSVSNVLLINPKNLRLYSYSYGWEGIRFIQNDLSAEVMIKQINTEVLSGEKHVHYQPGVEFSHKLILKDAERIELRERPRMLGGQQEYLNVATNKWEKD